MAQSPACIASVCDARLDDLPAMSTDMAEDHYHKSSEFTLQQVNVKNIP